LVRAITISNNSSSTARRQQVQPQIPGLTLFRVGLLRVSPESAVHI